VAAVRPSPLSCVGWRAGRFQTAISPEKPARFVWSLHFSLECPRASRGVLLDSGCRPPRWRFSVRHSRDGRRGVPLDVLCVTISDGASFSAPGRSCFPRCLRPAPWLRCPKIGGAQSVITHGPGFWGSDRSRSRIRRSASKLKTACAVLYGGNLRRSAQCP
jgi:hypothetical protein